MTGIDNFLWQRLGKEILSSPKFVLMPLYMVPLFGLHQLPTDANNSVGDGLATNIQAIIAPTHSLPSGIIRRAQSSLENISATVIISLFNFVWDWE